MPHNLFEKQKPVILIQIPFYDRNEHKSKDFTPNFYECTNNKFKITKLYCKKEKKFFSIDSEKKYLSCNIYQRIYKFKKDYIGETERNIKTRWIKVIIQHKI